MIWSVDVFGGRGVIRYIKDSYLVTGWEKDSRVYLYPSREWDLNPFKLKEIFCTEDRKNTGEQRIGSKWLNQDYAIGEQSSHLF